MVLCIQKNGSTQVSLHLPIILDYSVNPIYWGMLAFRLCWDRHQLCFIIHVSYNETLEWGVPISNQLSLETCSQTNYITKVNDVVSYSQPPIGQQPLLLLWIQQLQVPYSLNTGSHPSRISLCFSVKLFYLFFKIDVNNTLCNFICSNFTIIITINIYNLSE